MTTTADTEVSLKSVDIVVSPAVPTKTKRRAPRGMVAIIIMMVVFLGIQLAVHTGVQSDHGKLRDPIYHEKLWLLKKWTPFFEPTSAKLRVLFLGSSRTQLLIDASSLNEDQRLTFNFGCAGCGPIAHNLYYHRLLADGLQADTVVIELHPAMLVNMHGNAPFEQKWLHTHRLNRQEVDHLHSLGWPIGTPPQFEPGAQFNAVSTYRMNLLDAYAPVLLPSPFGLGMLRVTDAHGHVTGMTIPEEDRWKFIAQSRVDYAEALEATTCGGPAWEAICELIRSAQLRSRVVLMVAPEGTVFRNWYAPGYLDHFRKKVNQLVADTGVSLIDGHLWLNDDQFSDGHHANPAGAAAFTTRLRCSGLLP
jgi:hypothetical protein